MHLCVWFPPFSCQGDRVRDFPRCPAPFSAQGCPRRDTRDIEDLLAFVRAQVLPSERAAGVLRDVQQFEDSPAIERRRAFPAIYLLLEKYLVEVLRSRSG